MRLLIIDDSRAMRLIIKRTIRQAGYGHHDIQEANCANDAIGQIKTDPPDLVLCDWNMPGMSGIELLQQLRSDGCEVRFGFITSERSLERRQMAREAGALFMVSKPFDSQTLQMALGPHLN